MYGRDQKVPSSRDLVKPAVLTSRSGRLTCDEYFTLLQVYESSYTE